MPPPPASGDGADSYCVFIKVLLWYLSSYVGTPEPLNKGGWDVKIGCCSPASDDGADL